MATKLIRLTHKIAIQLHLDLYHLQFSLQAASPETSGYTLVQNFNIHPEWHCYSYIRRSHGGHLIVGKKVR
jgi:hypothetical protein